jgi:hypothetical protein
MTNRGTRKGRIDDDINTDSPILLTQYSSEASQLIKSFTKNIPFVVIILILIASMTIFDLVMDLGFKNILSDETIDAMIIVVSVFLIIFIIYTVRPVLRSQKILDKWSNLFENNAIRTSILLTINNNSKEEVLNALSETIEEIGIPLQHYLSKSNNHNEFYDVNIDDTTTTTCDILIDSSTIKPIDSDSDSDSLRNTIQDYGSILVKIVNGIIDKDITQSFIESLRNYKKRGNKIGLAMIIAESVDPESYNIMKKIKDKIISEKLIFIEKPTFTDSDLKNLNDILT